MSDYIVIIFRSLIYIVSLIVITRLLGKKQISEVSFFEYASGITIGSLAGEGIMGLDKNIGHGVVAIFIFGFITLFVDKLALKSKKFRDLIEGQGTILIKDGKILEEHLKKEKYSIDELSSLLRQKNIFNLSDVEFAILEPKGDLSVLLKKENRPLTPKDLKLKVASDKVPEIIIMDGKIINDSMATSGKNRSWLNGELEKLGVTLENVFMAQVDSYGELTVDIYDDHISLPSPQVRPLLMAMIKKCQADLELFSLETDSAEAKGMYNKNAKKLEKMINILDPYLNK